MLRHQQFRLKFRTETGETEAWGHFPASDLSHLLLPCVGSSLALKRGVALPRSPALPICTNHNRSTIKNHTGVREYLNFQREELMQTGNLLVLPSHELLTHGLLQELRE